MKLFMTLAFSALFIGCFSQDEPGKDREVIFRGVNIIPMDSDRIIMNQDVVVKSGRITAIGNNNTVKYANNAITVEAKGKYLMPGLAEMHGHVPPVDDIEPMKEVMLLFAAYGITTVRGMLGHPKHIELRNKINSGEITSPRFFTSGPSFNGESVKTPEEAAAKVKEQKNTGYDFLKIHPGLTTVNYDAMVKTADEVKIRFAGHVPFLVGVWHAIESNQETIDHMDAFIEGLIPNREDIKENDAGLFGMYIADRVDTTLIPKLMNALKEKNVWVVPTQALAERWMTPVRNGESFRKDPEMKYMDSKTLDNWVNSKTNMFSNPKYDSVKIDRYIKLRRKLIQACNDHGVGLLLGCDAPQVFNVPGISTHHELQYLVDAGLSPYEALKTGTINIGKFYNQPEIGVIKKGAYSDLILLNGNPLDDISNSKKIEGVMLGNKWFSRSSLDQILKKLEKSGAAQN